MALINQIIQGDALDKLNELPRDKKGRFIKGISYNPKGQFIKGYTYRKPKLYWDKTWLWKEYRDNKKSANQIAKEQGCKENNILYFLNKYNIPIWTMKEIRERKYWGLPGEQNGMYGKYGKDNPNWNGGHSPERQNIYARYFWKELSKTILKRDNYKCQECGTGHTKNSKLIIHHIKNWSKYPELRFNKTNLITLCEECHKNIHRKGVVKSAQ